MNARRDDTLQAALDADPLASLRADAIADLAFGSLTVGTVPVEGGHLAFLSPDALELDLDDPLQRRFGDYELVELIGEGGMGVVYRAQQISLDRDVAVKLLAAGPWASRTFIERFRREAQNAARMQHPNIVAIYEVGSADEMHFFSMRLINGPSLAAQVKREKTFAPKRAAALVRTIAEAVDYAHRLGVLHLDLKPANVLIDENGAPHVADFGLARRLEQGLAADNHEVSGTPSYMAPEQAITGSQRITPATDIWGLGAILYELVTGAPPFLADSPQATLKLVLDGNLRPPSDIVPTLPRDLEAIIDKCMARETAHRYASARALADDLGRFLENRAVQARPLSHPQKLLRWAQRQPIIALLSLLFVVSLIIGIVGVTSEWQRAEHNALVSNERLWNSRNAAARQLQREGRGFESLTPLIANIDEQEKAGRTAEPERRMVGVVLNDGVVLVNRMHWAEAKHASPFSVDISPDGTLFAVAMTDLTVHWFDTATLAEKGSVDLLGLPVSTDREEMPTLLHFVDDHRLIVTLDWLDMLTEPQQKDSYLIDLDRGSPVEFPPQFADLSSAAFSADGGTAILFDRTSHAQIWRVNPWQAISPPLYQDYHDESFLLERHGTVAMAVGLGQDTLTLLDPRTLHSLTDPKLMSKFGIHAWAQSNDGKQFAYGDLEGRIFLMDAGTHALRQLPTPVGREVNWLSFSEDDAWVAAVRQDGAAYAFDVAKGDRINAGEMQESFELRRVAINHRERLLIASGNGKSALWRLPQPEMTGLPAARISTSPQRPASGGPYSLAFAANTGLMITADYDGEIRLWRAPKSPVLDAKSARRIPGDLPFDGEHVVDVAFDKLRVVRVDGSAATPWKSFPQPLEFAELTDGGRTVVATSGTRMHILDAGTLQLRVAVVDLENSPMRLAVNSANNVVVVSFPRNLDGNFVEEIRSYDLHSGALLAPPQPIAGPLRQLELSADGKRLLATGSYDQPTRVFDARSLKETGAFANDPAAQIVWASFKNDDALFVLSRTEDPRQVTNRITEWHPGSPGATNTVHEITGTKGASLISVAGKPFIAGTGGDVLNAGLASETLLPAPVSEETMTALAISHDGRFVAHAFRYGVQLYDSQTGAAIGVPLHADLVAIDALAQIAFSPDDRRLLARTLEDHWVMWSIDRDDRTTAELRASSDVLNAKAGDPALDHNPIVHVGHDTGVWKPKESRPVFDGVRTIGTNPIPGRSADASPLLLDMTNVYNTAPDSLGNLMFNFIPTMGFMPLGIARIDGVDYDVRGALQLHSFTSPLAGVDFKHSVSGIAVPPVPIAAFHPLLVGGMLVPGENLAEQARLVLHYRDGSTAALSIRSGVEIASGYDESESGVPYAWVWGDPLRLMGYLTQHLLGNPRLANPHPERLVASLDIEVPVDTLSNPAFFAITAEPVIADGKSGSNEHPK
jgi:serine/threonine protein kinase/WD40 repeat protein